MKTNTKQNIMSEPIIDKLRRDFKPRIPKILSKLSALDIKEIGQKTKAVGDVEEIEKMFPLTFGQKIIDICMASENNNEKRNLKIGVVLSGGQAPGGHNVITGLFDSLKELNEKNTLIGFLNGPNGVMKNDFKILTKNIIDQYRNTGGFDIIKSGRDKIQTEEQMLASLKTIEENDLDGLVVIGGDDSNTNAAILAEFFQSKKSKCSVIGVPKTIDGDLQNEYIEISFGFDTAVKTYSSMISNIARDAVSASKAWHFIRLMGRDASHITLDCAIKTQPNITLIGEEIKYKKYSLDDIIKEITNVIIERAKRGKNYGNILIPEGIISFIPSMKQLINDLNGLLKAGSKHLEIIEKMEKLGDKISYVRNILNKKSLKNFDILPPNIQSQFLLERDPHGNIQMSQIPIEELFILICEENLKKDKRWLDLGMKFRGQGHFYGYDGRSCFPSNFDTQYCYALGRVSSLLLNNGKNGYMARIYDLEKDVLEWRAGAIPITFLMNMETRHMKKKPVIRKSLVNVESGKKFAYFNKNRHHWRYNDCYRSVEPIQFFGPKELTDTPPINVLIKKTNDVKWPL